MAAPFKTQITDTLYVGPEGGTFEGSITISAPAMEYNSAFLKPWVRSYQIVAGVVNISLVPNDGGDYASYYTATYKPKNTVSQREWVEMWQVPTSNTAITVQDVQADPVLTSPEGNKITDPTTTTGDMLYRPAAGPLARLAIGTEGQILSSVGSLPTWVTRGVYTGDGLLGGAEFTGDIQIDLDTSIVPTFTTTTGADPTGDVSVGRLHFRADTNEMWYAAATDTWMRVGIGSEKAMFTPEGGVAIRLINKTGAASVKGMVIRADSGVDGAFIVALNTAPSPIGIVYESGIADGSLCWVVVSGIAEVLLKDGTASTRGYWARLSDTDGRADITAALPSGGTINALEGHLFEIGHCIESKTSGTDVLAKIVTHYL